MNNEFENFDAIIVGSGQGGTPLAMELARSSWKVALVERWHVGGSCINIACTPTKTMIASARVAHLVSRAGEFGINSNIELVDLLKIVERKKEVVESFRNGLKKQLLSTKGLTLMEGEARFIGKKLLEVSMKNGEKSSIKSDLIVINTGASPSVPPIKGLETTKYYNSTSIMEIKELPRHLLVIGGGYIGLEFGQMFRRLGSKVTIIQLDGQLLPNEDSDIAEEVTSILKGEGIEILLSAKTEQVQTSQNGEIVLTFIKDKKEQTVEGSHLLVATGRVPNSSNLNLETTGIKTEQRGFIPVNNRLETEVPGIFAIGDVNGEPQFTHISYDDYRIISKNILQNGNATTSGRQLPYVVFIDPQLGRIGMTEKAA
ncbi:MAG TPA: FAD-dependent oxidoreductase, partial [Atribacterota bacterium]|nr:FAD-dependent oxidoreductase [Atribacterota bacterium]